MSRFDVTMLEEAVEDVLIGKQFYEESEEGVGVYFAASALADITSLSIYAGIHSSHFGYFRLLDYYAQNQDEGIRQKSRPDRCFPA